jgi:predicted lipid-binding transport protein (Tim44 family)
MNASSHATQEEIQEIMKRGPVGPDLPPPPPRGNGMGFAVILCFGFVLVLLLFLQISRRRALREADQRPIIRVNPILKERAIELLKERDPSFDAAAFLERIHLVVAAVNKAWLAGDMGPARRVISDGVYVRFMTQLQLLRSQGLRNAMADFCVVSAEILAADCDDLWDTLHVKIVGAARDLDLPAALSPDEAEKRLRRAELREYDEAWSFVRRRGKSSRKGVPALEGRCPSCGADLPLSEVVRCEYCKALVNSGEHDWVLAEITQAAEWRSGASAKTIPGLDALRERDPSVSRQELEDRVSVSFWKWIEARSTDKPDKLARFCMKLPQDAATRAALSLSACQLREVAVGSADLKRIEQREGTDQASLEVRWSAASDGQAAENHRHVFVLGRAAEAKSRRGLSSLDCPSCGGPLANSDDVTCRYCGTALTGGKHEWALLEVRERPEKS